MQVSCLQENLNRGLAVVGRAVAGKTTLPILGNILFTTQESQLKLSATNLEIGINYWVPAKVEEPGSLTVPARLLTDFVGSLPADRVDLTVTPKTQSLQIRCGRFDARINGIDPEDFPAIPVYEGEATATIDPEALRAAIHQVAFAAATDDTRPVLTGVLFRFQGNDVTMAGADGFRLAVHRAPLREPAEEEIQILVPARARHELERLLGDEEDPVALYVNPGRSQVLFHLQRMDLVAQLIQGTFPNFSQLIPKSYVTRTILQTSDFQRATRIAAVFARDSSGIVRLQIAPGEGTVSAGRVTIPSRAEETAENQGEVDAAVEGDEARIAFNSRYLLEVLGVLNAEQVALETTGPSNPGVLRPVGNENYTHVVMPMFVQW